MPAALAKLRLRLATFTAVAFVIGAVGGCTPRTATPSYPPAQGYAVGSDFAGVWVGEVNGIAGELSVQRMGSQRYYGYFRGESKQARYTLALDQQAIADGEEAQAKLKGTGTASNLCLFTWQDGHGGRGAGWLLINREDSALTGTFGRNTAHSGVGQWTFIRAE